MGEAHYQPVRLVRLEITNFKAIDRLEIDLPTPLTSMDPDVLVLGSRNGLGKTSVLEACAMLFVSSRAALDDRGNISSSNFGVQLAVNPFDLLIRGGGDQARLSADFAVGGQRYQLVVSLSSDGQWKAGGDKDELSKALHPSGQRRSGITQLLWALLGLSADPFVAPPFLYFHSYRKVQEGNPELGAMVEDTNPRHFNPAGRADRNGTSRFKLEILRSLMGQARLFESVDEAEADSTIDVINRLMRRYAGGVIRNLRPLPDNTVDFCIQPLGGGPTFTFDGLSSGQKEIISTLFLIWRHTHDRPGIVLIDEPELHLNVEWHRSLVAELQALAPANQYLLATHSEDIFGSVEEAHRMLLVPEDAIAVR